MDVEFESYRDAYRKCAHHGKFLVIDLKEKIEDYDGTVMNLCKGTYTMVDGDIKKDCLIKKFPTDRTKLRLYSLLKNIRHQNILPVLNFYEVSGQPRFVFSWADGTISAWIKAGEGRKMLKSNLRGRCPSPRFREIIIDTCSGLEHLFKEKIYPFKIGAEDIVTCELGSKHITKLLIYEAQELEAIDEAKHMMKLWADVKATLKKIFNDCGNTETDIDPISLKFFDAIGTQPEKLENYPDNWNTLQKAKYLLKIMSIDRGKVAPEVQKKGIEWPTNNNGKLTSPLYNMVVFDKTRKFPSNYSTSDPYDFLRICKDLPESVKDGCASWEIVVEKMDKWNPAIWCILYDIFG